MTAQRTPLYTAAIREGASLQEWGGWELPLTYSGVLEEYVAATEAVALHDASHTCRIKGAGADVLDLLNRLSTNEVVSLTPGEGAPTVLTTDRGRIMDVISVHNLGDHILIISSPGSSEKIIEWIDKYTIVDDVVLEDITSTTAMLAVIGPRAQDLLSNLTPTALEPLTAHQSAQVTIAGAEGYIIRRDLVSLPRYEILVEAEDGEKVWQQIIAAGAVPLGLEAYEVVRVAAVSPGPETELGESYNPLEAGLWGSISFTKGCYIGQEVIARLDTYQKVQRHLVSLSFSPGSPVEEGAKLVMEGKEVGLVTSVAKVPTTGELIGLGYVRKEASAAGTGVTLAEGGEGRAKVEAQALPFGPGEDT